MPQATVLFTIGLIFHHFLLLDGFPISLFRYPFVLQYSPIQWLQQPLSVHVLELWRLCLRLWFSQFKFLCSGKHDQVCKSASNSISWSRARCLCAVQESKLSALPNTYYLLTLCYTVAPDKGNSCCKAPNEWHDYDSVASCYGSNQYHKHTPCVTNKLNLDVRSCYRHDHDPTKSETDPYNAPGNPNSEITRLGMRISPSPFI